MGHLTQSRPDALALDFDGVICNGLREYFQTSLRAYHQLWPSTLETVPVEWEETFGRLRPVVETGWEMPLVLRALHQGWTEAEILLSWPTLRTQILTQNDLDWRSVGRVVDLLRDHWINEDLEGWLSLHSFYPGVEDQLRHWLDQKLPIFIITTKESRFVQRLLAQAGITLSPTNLFGKDCQQPKSATLRQLQAQGYHTLWFVEDRLATLTTIQTQEDLASVALFLADWGYNTADERQKATTTASLRLISLSQFRSPFAQWLTPL